MRKVLLIPVLLVCVILAAISCSMRQDLFDIHSRNGSGEDDSFSVKVDVGDGLITKEDPVSPLSDTFYVSLNQEPTGEVHIGTIQSLALDEVTVSPSSLTFTTSNWNVPQAVTVTGVDDGISDGLQIAVVDLGTASGAEYQGVDPGNVTVQNLDDETAGSPSVIVINDGLITSEDGSVSDSFSIVLNEAPTASVSVGTISSTDTGEVTVSTSSLTFTTANWGNPQTVNLSGVDDLSFDGMQPVVVNLGSTTSSDPNWNGLSLGSVTVYNLDDDGPKGITVLAGSSMMTSETGIFSQFEVVLDAQPSAPVDIPVSSSDTTEGLISSPASGVLSFTTSSWSTPQTVRVTGVDDALADGNQAFTVILGSATSSDAEYDGLNPLDVVFTSVDDDAAGITVFAGSQMLVSESGTSSSFQVVLGSQPASDVDIPVSSDTPAEGLVTAPASGFLIFTTGNWSTPQTVWVQGVDDGAVDGNQPFYVVLGAVSSGDGTYSGMNPPDVAFLNVDDDDPAVKSIVVSAGTSTLVSESGSSSSFEIVLSAAPTANVDISISSSNTSAGVISIPASGTLTFGTGNWSTPQQVTVSGVDDFVADGNQSFTVVIGAAVSTDLDYDGLNPADLNFQCVDDDSPGITVSAGSSMLVSESGTTSSFEVMLNSEPTNDVSVDAYSDNTAEGLVVDPVSKTLVFTAANWSIPQSVTVQGVDDGAVDGNQPFNVVLDPASSSDVLYNGIDPSDVAFKNIDDDSTVTKSIVVSAGSSTLVSENGGSSSYDIVLSAPPLADVDIDIYSNDTTEGVVTDPATGTITFTPGNWSTVRTVTVSGVDDGEADGNQSFAVVIDAAVSGDLDYDGQNPVDLTFECVDDDSPGITVSAGSSMLVSESGTTSSFEVVLNSRPLSDVSIDVWADIGTEGMVADPASGTITFTTADWDMPQTVMVQGVDDAVADGNRPFMIVLDNVLSGDALYSAIDPDDVSFVNIDDDAPGITVDIGDGLVTDEMGMSDTFKIVLNTEPTADVTLSTIDSFDGGEVNVNTTSITFTAANWSTTRIVTVTGVDDFLMDGLQSVTIDLGTASSSDTTYDGMDPGDVVVHNIDDESIPQFIVLNPPPELITTENGASVDIKIILNQMPTADVTLSGMFSMDAGEGTVTAPASGDLIFTASNWNVPHIVTVTGLDDAMLDGDVVYDVDLGTASSADPNWNGLWAGSVAITNLEFALMSNYTWALSGGLFTSIQPTGAMLTLIDTDYYDAVIDPMDEGYNYLPLGFTFYYMGMPYDKVTVYSNGMVSFNPYHYTTNSFANDLLFDNTATGDLFDNVLAPWWDDLILDQSALSGVYYETSGVAPNRVLTIEWTEARVYGEDEYYSFQIKLYEGSNAVEFVYGFMDDPANPKGTSASIGIKDDGIGDNSFIDGISGIMTLPNAAGSNRNVGDFPAIDTVIEFKP
jgi:hypothetical protein